MGKVREAALVASGSIDPWAKLRGALSGVRRQVVAIRASAEYGQIDERLIADAALDRDSYCGRPRRPWW